MEERMARLEDAHRELAAQHLALHLTCRAMLPLIAAAPEHIRRRLRTARETNNALMAEHGFDGAYQERVRHWLEIHAAEIQEGADRPDGHPNAA